MSSVSLFLCTLLFSTVVRTFPVEYQMGSDVVDCLNSQQVPYALKDSPNWKALSTPYNLRLVFEPAVITVPETSDHVSSSVTCAAAAGLKVQAKGGGHSYASYSSGGQNGSLIVDMEKFSAIDVDQSLCLPLFTSSKRVPTTDDLSATYIAKIGAGQRLGNIAQAVYEQGGRAFPHGTCPGVGIAGHALHGGYGYASRKWGLALDHIVALDVILANGTQIHTNSESYPDIFYAMRGAGDSFGIATYFYIQTEAAPSSVLSFSASLQHIAKNTTLAAKGFDMLQTFSLNSPDLTPNITFGLYIDSGGSFGISGWCMECNHTIFSNDVLPAMLSGFPSTTPSVKDVKWIEALEVLANGDTLAQPLGSKYTQHETFYAKSVVTKEAEPLTTESILRFFSYIIENRGKGPFYSIINLYGGPGSAINTPAPDSSAYADRDALWVIQNYGYAPNDQSYDSSTTGVVGGLGGAVTTAQPDGNFAGYINYVDPGLSAMAAAEEYYGKKTYDKLLQIKMDVGPGFVFWNPQAVGNTPVL